MSETEIIPAEGEAYPANLVVPADPAHREAAGAQGLMALAQMSESDFQLRLAWLEQGQQRLQIIHQRLLVRDVDYGVIPGTQNPTLLKPGAEKLCLFYGLVACFEHVVEYGDGVTAPQIAIRTLCRIRQGSESGPVVGTGWAAASSWEKRYRYRYAGRVCPHCGKDAIIRGKPEYGGGWLCYEKKGGCKAKWRDGAPEIEEQVVGEVENPDPWELYNTLVKMSTKRAHVDATIRALGLGGLYTQDMEEAGAPAAHGLSDYNEPLPVAPPALPQQPSRRENTARRPQEARETPSHSPRGQTAPAASNQPVPCVVCGSQVPPARAATCTGAGKPVTHPRCEGWPPGSKVPDKPAVVGSASAAPAAEPALLDVEDDPFDDIPSASGSRWGGKN